VCGTFLGKPNPCFQRGREFTCIKNLNAYARAMRNPYIVFDLFCVFSDDGSECGWGLGEGSNFQLVRGPQV